MDKQLRETINLCVEIMKSKRQVKGKLGHVVQIRFGFNLFAELRGRDTRQLSRIFRLF